MKKAPTLSPATIQQNIRALQALMEQQGLDGFYVSSFDPYLNEYVPLEDCHRYYVTGFTGSVAEVLVPRHGKARVYVDGRYHEQVDLEVPAEAVEAVKPAGVGNAAALIADVRALGLRKVGLESDRTSLGFMKQLGDVCETVALPAGALEGRITFAGLPAPKEINLVARQHRGRDTLEKTAPMFTDDRRGIFLAALDGIAWVTNCRGYHLPHLSSFRAKALVTRRKVYVFVTPETPVSAQARQSEGLEWVFVNAAGTAAELERLQNALHLDRVELDPSQLSAADYGMLLRVFGPDRLEEKRGGVVEWMSIKEPAEISAMEEGFRRGDRAIHATLKWAKDAVTAGKSPSERELWEQTTIQYRAQGAVEQSFNTIAGVGPNGSIIHYGNPSADVKIKPSDMVLLDSGGYFDGGFATDTTRTFFASHTGRPDPEHRKIYTLVLKGLLACQYAVFADGTKGIVLDGLARAPLMKHGFNFNHGTGHGVGVHVHEDGVRLSPLSNLPMRAGQVVSIEPGIYVPGFAGVRLENVALVEAHPQFKGFLRFRSLVWVGFDPALVDVALLNDEEKAQWADYEKGCAARGTSFMSAV